jgi:MFS superfamily sulfate permease-like transporter
MIYIGIFVVSFALGIMIGIFISIWYLVFDFSFNFDHAITVNVMIAVTTMIATAIHFDSVRHQRKDRLWEINKESLLKLSKAISDSMNVYKPLLSSIIIEAIKEYQQSEKDYLFRKNYTK